MTYAKVNVEMLKSAVAKFDFGDQKTLEGKTGLLTQYEKEPRKD